MGNGRSIGGGGNSGGGSGTVTSIGVTVPTDILAVSPSAITNAGVFAIIKTTQAANKIFAGPVSGADTVPAFRSLVDNDIPDILTVSKIANLTANGFVKTSAGDGTLSIDASTYLTANQTITLSGDASGSGTTAITATLSTVNSSPGSFAIASITVNGKGLVTAASAASTTGSGSVVLATSPTIVSPTIAKLANLTANGFVKTSGGVGTLSVDISTYITGNQTITLSGDVTGSGATAITTTLATVNSNVGSFAIATVTVNAKGLVTAASAASVTGTGSVVLSDGADIGHSLISGGSIDSTVIGALFPDDGYFLNIIVGGITVSSSYISFISQVSDPVSISGGLILFAGASDELSWRVGNGADTYSRKFAATLTASRTYTLPDYNATVASLSGTEVFTNKTLTTPTIGDFTNSTHTHQNAAGGGQLNASSVFSAGTLPAARMPALTGDITTAAGAVATTLATVNSNVGSFAIATITVNAKGLITAASAASTTGSGNVVLDTSPTIVTPTIASFTNATHNHQNAAGGGQLNATSVFSAGTLPAAQMPALTGDITTSAGAVATTLATVNSNTGSFAIATITVNGKGLITAASAATTTGSGSVVLATSPTITTPTIAEIDGGTLLKVSDSGTNTVVDVLTVTHDSNGSIAAVFGTGILINGQSTTTADRSMGRIRTQWVTATDASRQAKLVLSSFDTSQRDVMELSCASSTASVNFPIGTTNFQYNGTTALQLNSATQITFSNGLNIAINTSTGTKIGTATTQKIGFWNATPVVQPSTTGTTTGFTANSGTAMNSASTATGNSGSTAYTFGDVVLALKQVGLLAA